MAQLRDAKTGELLAEGTPTEVVAIADELKLKATVVGIGEEPKPAIEVMYDDVGLGFDPDAVRKAAAVNRDGLAAAAKVEKDKDAKANIVASLKDATAAVEQAKPAAEKAKKALDKARSRAGV